MNTADRIGLLPGFGWLADHSFGVTLGLCLLVTPIGHCLVGLLLESRWVPISPGKQFLSFFPGDIFLGIATACLLVAAKQLPDENRRYNATWWHIAVLVVMVIVAVWLVLNEFKGGLYPSRAILSPTKIYHTIILIGGFGYLIVTTLFAVGAQARGGWLVAAILPGLVWVGLLVHDSTLGPQRAKEIARHAHIAHWHPILWNVWK